MVTCSWTLRSLFGQDGELTGYQTIGRDVTNERRQHALLRETQRMEALAVDDRVEDDEALDPSWRPLHQLPGPGPPRVVADVGPAIDPEVVHHAEDPLRLADRGEQTGLPRLVAGAEADQIGGDHPMPLGDQADDHMAVEPGAGRHPVDQEGHRAVAGALVEVAQRPPVREGELPHRRPVLVDRRRIVGGDGHPLARADARTALTPSAAAQRAQA